jgi:hypothetical protein
MKHSECFVTRRAILIAFVATFALLDPCVGRAQALNACDLNGDGVVNTLDVQLATNMALAVTPCTANVAGAGICNIVVVQRVANAAVSGSCFTGVPHSTSLSWTASTSSNITGYHVYRSTQASGPYTKLTSAPVATTTYTDITVLAGQTYYYVTTAVDNTNTESVYSNQATAVVPTP